jgi:hypothetical protein
VYWKDDELRASIESTGVIVPALQYAGTLHDGRRRERIASDLGQQCPVYKCRSYGEFAVRLFAVEPRRAMEHFGPSTIAECQKLFGCSAGAAALMLPAHEAPKPRKNWNKKNIQRTFWVSAQLWARLSTFASENGWSTSELIRRGCLAVLEHPEVVFPHLPRAYFVRSSRRTRGANKRPRRSRLPLDD